MIVSMRVISFDALSGDWFFLWPQEFRLLSFKNIDDFSSPSYTLNMVLTTQIVTVRL